MSLLLIIQKAPDSVVVKESSKSIGSEGGTIGRGRDNTLVLDDPERYLSNVHCEISFENGQFYLIDRSTNGTFYNKSSDPIGKGEKLPIRNNDTFILGDYEFLVEESSDSSQSDHSSNSPASDLFANAEQQNAAMSIDDIFAAPLSNDHSIPDAQSDKAPAHFGYASNADPLVESDMLEKDPLAALNKVQGKQDSNSPLGDFDVSPDPFSSPLQTDQVDPLKQQLSWPESPAENSLDSPGAIPDDWDDDFLSPGADAPPLTPAPAAVLPDIPAKEALVDERPEVAISNQKPAIPPHPVKPRIADRSFINALGLDSNSLDDAQIAQFNQLAGEVFREMVKGLMMILASRNTVKNEFRMNVTTIQPKENNPLKFSANVNDALENMFLKSGDAYLKPLEAVHDGFDSIAEHQLSILAGIRQAFTSVTGHFDPKSLEEHFSKIHKGALLPVSQKAKNWESYVEYYNEMAGDMDKSFKNLYWDGFVRAYEDQLNKLSISRKAKNFKNR